MKIDTDTEEGKAELQKLIDNATTGLKEKNAELLGDQKKLKDSMKSIQTQLDEIAAAKEAAEQDALSKSGDVEKIKSALEEKHRKEKDTLTAALNEKDATLRNLVIDNGLTDALTKAGVAPQYLDAARALIQTKHKGELGEADGAVIATFDGKPIKDFVTEWSQGDSGKHFIAAPNNSGGGANGANGGGKASTAKADMGGDRAARAAAIAQKFPSLAEQ